ncbi:hypothetical protein BGZ94_007298, partial [Podila epigama]
PQHANRHAVHVQYPQTSLESTKHGGQPSLMGIIIPVSSISPPDARVQPIYDASNIHPLATPYPSMTNATTPSSLPPLARNNIEQDSSQVQRQKKTSFDSTEFQTTAITSPPSLSKSTSFPGTLTLLSALPLNPVSSSSPSSSSVEASAATTFSWSNMVMETFPETSMPKRRSSSLTAKPIVSRGQNQGTPIYFVEPTPRPSPLSAKSISHKETPTKKKKKARNSFLLYRQAMVERHRDLFKLKRLSSATISKELGTAWRMEDESVKRHYEVLADRERVLFEQEDAIPPYTYRPATSPIQSSSKLDAERKPASSTMTGASLTLPSIPFSGTTPSSKSSTSMIAESTLTPVSQQQTESKQHVLECTFSPSLLTTLPFMTHSSPPQSPLPAVNTLSDRAQQPSITGIGLLVSSKPQETLGAAPSSTSFTFSSVYTAIPFLHPAHYKQPDSQDDHHQDFKSSSEQGINAVVPCWPRQVLATAAGDVQEYSFTTSQRTTTFAIKTEGSHSAVDYHKNLLS